MSERKPLDAQFVSKTNQAAMRALADVTARRKWAHSVSGSPVTTNMLCAEIARLNLEREILWCVHVRGPDDMVPAPDYATALRWADLCLATDRKPHRHEYDPYLTAVPAPWPYSAEQHAASLPKSEEYFTGKKPSAAGAAS